MQRKHFITILVCLTLFLILQGGQPTRLGYHSNWSDELDHLSKMGIAHRFIDNETIELTESWSGFRRVKSLREPDKAAVTAWIQRDSIPLLEIDPSTVDTNQYSGWYTYWTSVPLSNDFGYPLIVEDINHNGIPEVYGDYRGDESLDFETRVYEVDSGGNALRRFDYVPRRGSSVQLVDVDKNGLQEVVFQLGDSSFFYEQPLRDSLPIRRKFAHAKYESCGAVGTLETVIEMDNDSLVDFVYRGSDQDSTCVTYKTYVAEYDENIGNFKKVWSIQLWPPRSEAGIGGYDVGDYDGDGKMNFCASGLFGQVWVLENNGDNNYCVNWTDSIPFVNLVYQTSGDVDGDGKREFFVSATMSNGNWITVYEADSNNHYSARFLFHLLSGGSLDEPTLMVRDVDGDGKLELIVFSGANLFVFKSGLDNVYNLWYLKKVDAKTSVQFYDFNKDGRMDFIISWKWVNPQGHLILSSDIYTASRVTGVTDDSSNELPGTFLMEQNYPNPFNPSTTIHYQIIQTSHVRLAIFDLLGREIQTLVDGVEQAGYHEKIFRAGNLPSGVYLYKLTTSSFTAVKKMLLVK